MNEFPPIFDADLNHVLQHVSAWENLRGARIFITGGTGFFGAWLLETFCHANEVLGLGAVATILSRDPQRFLAKMPHLENRADLHFLAGEVRTLEPSTLDMSTLAGGNSVGNFSQTQFTHVIHAATASGEEAHALSASQTFDTIVEGTRRVLRLAAKHRAQRVLLVSSGAVYGAQPRELSHIGEEYSGAPDSQDLRAAYGAGKRAAEFLCRAYGEENGASTSVARGFAFVGPHLPLDAHFAIGNFLRDARNGASLKISGDGTPVRSYLYAADLAVWLWEILLRGENNRAYNVGSENAVSILETAQIVANAFEEQHTFQPEILVAQQAAAGVLPPRYVPSTQRAQGELGLRQIIQLPEAVARTLRFISA